jgi:hypothetical protein
MYFESAKHANAYKFTFTFRLEANFGKQDLHVRETSDAIRTPEVAFQIFRSYRIVITELNNYVRSGAVQGQTIAVFLMGVSALYATIRLYGKVNMLSYLTFPSCLLCNCITVLVVYGHAGSLPESSKNFIASWKQKVQSDLKSPIQIQNKNVPLRHVLGRTLRAFFNLEVKVGQFYSYQPSTAKTFTQLVVDNTINMLLAF